MSSQRLSGSRPSEVYNQFEKILNDEEIHYPDLLDPENEIPVKLLGFNRIEGGKKYYDLKVENKIEIYVSIEMVDDERYEISEITSIEDDNRLGKYLEESLSVQEK